MYVSEKSQKLHGLDSGGLGVSVDVEVLYGSAGFDLSVDA